MTKQDDPSASQTPATPPGPRSGHPRVPEQAPGGEPESSPGEPKGAPGGEPGDTAPLRVSTLELFFDLVFAFTLTRLTTLLARHLSVTGAIQVVLVFGVLWWMYGAYAWLTNTRTPDRTPERLLLLLGMAGFLVAGLAIPEGSGPTGSASGVALGLGYLLVVVVHSVLYYRVNRNILRVTPFNVTSALLVIGAGLTGGVAAYLLWAAALAIQVLSPLIVHPGGRFYIQPAHFVERHGALVIVALGESVAALGIAAAAHGVTFAVALTAVLGLALSASLWWVYFGGGDDERAERAMTAAEPTARPGLALAGYFYAHIPMLLGVVVMAAGVKLTIGHAAQPHPAAAIALACGVALFLGGDAWFRRVLRIGRARPRAVAAVAALATAALGATVAVEAQMAVLVAGIAAMLCAEHYRARRAGPLPQHAGE
jgi:low temperature requirement protein LtrA